MRNKKYVVLVFVLALVLFAGCARKKQVQQNAPAGSAPATANQDTGCPSGGEPVCGTDGATYASACFAEKSGVGVARTGACPSPSVLTPDERKYLLWLLQRRIERQLPNVTVFHKQTLLGSCAECSDFYYRWGSPEVIVRIRVDSGSVTAALDTSGYNYLSGTQSEPATFPEVQGSS